MIKDLITSIHSSSSYVFNISFHQAYFRLLVKHMKAQKRTFLRDPNHNDIKTAPVAHTDMTLFVVELHVETCPEIAQCVKNRLVV